MVLLQQGVFVFRTDAAPMLLLRQCATTLGNGPEEPFP
jgi:hypothetical protein